MIPIELREFEAGGRLRFSTWYAKLDPVAAAKVTTALTRLSFGNTSNVKGVGAGVCELKIDFGPGYRIYFGNDGPRLILLLGGGTKKRQQNDIETAKKNWKAYQAAKSGKV